MADRVWNGDLRPVLTGCDAAGSAAPHSLTGDAGRVSTQNDPGDSLKGRGPMMELPAPDNVRTRHTWRAPNSYDAPNGSRRGRVLRLAAGEFQELHPRARLVQGLAGCLPQLWFNRVRTALWRAADVQIGEGALLMGQITLSGSGDWPRLLSIGRNTRITGPLRIDLGGPVHIGDDVNIGHDCVLLTVEHEIGPEIRRAGFSAHGAIVIERGVSIASRVTILPGVTIGEGAVVATGAVVASHVMPHTLVGGVPAKLLRVLNGSDPNGERALVEASPEES